MSFFTKRYHPPGTPPGTLTEAAGLESRPFHIRLVDFSPAEISVKENVSPADCLPYLQRDTVSWVHVQGRPSPEALQQIGTIFQLHPLALEDVLNSGQRPKVEPFEEQLFLVMSLPGLVDGLVQVRQVSFFLNAHFLISFCDGEADPFMPVIKRLQDAGARVRNRSVDYLLYSLVDIVIDQGFPVLESFGLQLEELEEQILTAVSRETLENIHTLKRELILLRRMLWPQRDVINQLLRDDFPVIHDETEVYLRDCYDHTIQVMDLLETYRDMTGSMLDIYLSSISNRMNEVMRVLTVIATIFIPLTFIVGVYGMNFDRNAGPWSMPELGWPYGYLLVWGIMLAIAGGMVFLFRRRGWF